MTRPSKRLITTFVRLNVGCRAIDYLESCLVACFVVVTPGTHAVMAKQNTFGLRVIFYQRFDLQPQLKTWSLPGNVNYVISINLSAQFFLIDACGNCDNRIWM